MKLTLLLAPIWLLFAFVSIRSAAAEVAQSPAPALLTWSGCTPDLSGQSALSCGVARSVQTWDQSAPITLSVEFRNGSFTDPTSFCGAALLDSSEQRYAEAYSWRDKGWSDPGLGWFVNENYRVGLFSIDRGSWHVGRVEWQPSASSPPAWKLTIDGGSTTVSYGQSKVKAPKTPKTPKGRKGQPPPPPTTSPATWPPNGEPPIGNLHVGLGYTDSHCYYRALTVAGAGG